MKVVIIIILAAILAIGIATPSLAVDVASVTVDAPGTVLENAAFDVSIDIAGITDLNSIQYDISFDSSIFRLNSITPGQIGAQTMDTMSNQIGDGKYRIVQTMNLETVSGSGCLAVLHLEAISPAGSGSEITITNGIAGGINGEIQAIWTLDYTTVSLPVNNNPAPPQSGGGGGGGGGAAGLLGISNIIDSNGTLLVEARAISIGAEAYIILPAGTACTSAFGGPIFWISILAMEANESPPPVTENMFIASNCFKLGPDEAVFDPPVRLTFNYKKSNLPDGITEDSLFLATWDEQNNIWVKLESHVDPANGTVWAEISHFSIYTVIADAGTPEVVQPATTTTPTTSSPPITTTTTTTTTSTPITTMTTATTTTTAAPQPASFTVSNLLITPDSVLVSEDVSIAAVLTNIGGSEGNYDAVLMINGTEESRQAVTLEAGTNCALTFRVTRELAGTYTVGVGDTSGLFTVANPTQPRVSEPVGALPLEEPASNWWIYIVAIAADVIIAGSVTYIFWKRRHSA